jgi:antitoxin component YwqK of YwqJK toxin-antitoxin module
MALAHLYKIKQETLLDFLPKDVLILLSDFLLTKQEYVFNQYFYCFVKNGKKEGLETGYYQNGKVRCKCFYKNSKKEGEETRYTPEGVLWQKCNYKNDGFNGEVRTYYRETGIICRMCTYKNDLPHGEYAEYDNYGRLIWKTVYEYGLPVR